MFSTKVRWLLVGLIIVSGIIAPFTQLGWMVSVVFFATALIMIMGHFRFGTVPGALLALRRANIEKAERLLVQIKRPDWLSDRYRAYYHLTWSLVGSFRQDTAMSKEHATLALAYPKLREQEKAILRYNLARVAFEEGDYEQAKQEVLVLDTMTISDLHLKQRLDELRKALERM